MKLYDIEMAMLECVDEETGETIDIERLEALEMERDKKISNIGCWIKDLKAESEALKNEKQALEKRQMVAEHKAESLKQFLQYYLNGAKYKDSRISISYRTTKAVNIAEDLDVNELPDDYKRVKVEANKTAIKDALTNGIEINGCSIVENTSMIIK